MTGESSLIVPRIVRRKLTDFDEVAASCKGARSDGAVLVNGHALDEHRLVDHRPGTEMLMASRPYHAREAAPELRGQR
jgi:hypothetical protein